MARYRKKKSGTDAFLDILPPLFGLLFLAICFVPGFRQLLGALFVVAIGLLIVVVVGLIGRAIWRHNRKKSAEESALPLFLPGVVPLRDLSPRNVTPPRPIWTRQLLSQLEWKRFEDVVAAYSRELGYEAKTTRIGADGGVDVQLFQNSQPNPVMIIQCKAWDAYKVGVKPVRELFGVMAADKVVNGAFFTTGEFTAEAEEWSRDKMLDLVDGAEFLTRIGQLAPNIQQKLLAIAIEGDYTTPTCPSCGVKMVSRTASKGRSEGSSFWGCRSYPRCRQTFKVTAVT